MPLARFLDETEGPSARQREDQTLQDVRRSFAPFFGMQMQVLKKRKLRDEGTRPVYVVQNHRPQIMYTEDDRGLMHEAWALTSALREDLVERCSQSAPAALPDRPSVAEA